MEFFIITLLLFLLFNLISNIYAVNYFDNLSSTVSKKTPLISILIPARNEESNISHILNSIIEQEYDFKEIIVFNDQSTDRTKEIVTNSFANNVTLFEDRGGQGKTFGCAELAKRAKGEILLFLDADVVLLPGAITRVVNLMENSSFLCGSLFPKLRYESLSERIFLPFHDLLFYLFFPIPLSHFFTDVRLTAATGQLIFCRHDLYKEIGGHLLVKGKILEDIALAQAFKKKGERFLVSSGRLFAEVRMYGSLRDIKDGFKRQLLGVRRDYGFTVFIILLLSINLVFVAPFFLLPSSTTPIFLLLLLRALHTIFLGPLNLIGVALQPIMSLGVVFLSAITLFHRGAFFWRGRGF